MSIVIEYDMSIGDDAVSTERDSTSIRRIDIETGRWIILIRAKLEDSPVERSLIEGESSIDREECNREEKCEDFECFHRSA